MGHNRRSYQVQHTDPHVPYSGPPTNPDIPVHIAQGYHRKRWWVRRWAILPYLSPPYAIYTHASRSHGPNLPAIPPCPWISSYGLYPPPRVYSSPSLWTGKALFSGHLLINISAFSIPHSYISLPRCRTLHQVTRWPCGWVTDSLKLRRPLKVSFTK